MAIIETWLKTDLQQVVKVQELDGNMFAADNGANRIGVIVTNHGEPVTLTSGITGYFIRPDEATVVIVGQISGNRGWIDLPASAYVKTGPFSIVIKNGTTTIGACSGYIRRSTTDEIVDPGHVIPSLEELLAEIANMRTATASANAATSAANTAAGSANTAAGAANTAAANADQKASAANTAAGAANTAAANANEKAIAANEAAVNANARAGEANTAAVSATNAAGAANTAAGAANTAAANANEKAGAANTAAGSANTAAANANEKATAANTAAGAANTAAVKIDQMTVAVTQGDPGSAPTVTLELVDGHYRLTFANVKGLKGDTGDAFHVVKTYASVAAMQADYSGTDVKIGEYVMVVSTVEDPDNAKVYIKGSSAWQFIVDMSGATGIKGDTGNGIASVSFSDYMLTLNFTDGTSYTTTSIRGATGPTGNGIASIVHNQDYTLTINMTDGTSYTTGNIRGATGETGPQGPTGATGNGISSVVHNQDYTLTINFTDGTHYTTGNIRGEKGEKGDTGSLEDFPLELVDGLICVTYGEEDEDEPEEVEE